MTVNGFVEGEDIEASYLTYPFGISTWAPNGEWGDASLSAPKKAVIDVMTKPADDGRYYPASPDEAEETEPASEETTSVAEEPAVAAEDKTPVVAKEAPAPDFGITVEEFIRNYETSLETLDQDMERLSTSKEETTADGRIVAEVSLDEFRSLIITANGSNRFVQGVIFLGGGEQLGAVEALAVLFGALAVGVALVDPAMDPEDQGNFGRELGLFAEAGEGIALGKTIEIERNGVQYSVSVLEGFGLTMGANPVK